MSSVINTTIKPFKTTAYHNGKFVPVSEADLKGKWSIFFFYPADFTFVCPTELGDVADIYQEFKKIGVEVYSVSTDTHFTHKAWHDASETIKKIQYPMLGDPTLFARHDFVEASWDLITPIHEAWAASDAKAIDSYEAGEWGPAAAQAMMAAEKRRWRTL